VRREHGPVLAPPFDRGRGNLLRRRCFIHVIGFNEAISQKRLHAPECITGLFQLRLRALYACFRGFYLELELGVLRSRHFDLLVETRERGFCLFQAEPVILGVNFEKHVSRSHSLIVLHIELDDLTSHARRNSNDVCPHDRVVRSWMVLDDIPDPKDKQDGSSYHKDADDQTDRLAPTR
jgi:hypothetical protein